MKSAHERALTPTNIIAGFRKSGIFPFDRNVFSDSDFMMCEVTNRDPQGHDSKQTNSSPNEDISDEFRHPQPVSALVADQIPLDPPCIRDPSSDCSTVEVSGSETSFPSLSPEAVKPYPKASERKTSRLGKRRGKSIIATDTPVKKALEEQKKKTVRPNTKQLKPVKKKILCDDSDSQDSDIELKSVSSTDDVDILLSLIHI